MRAPWIILATLGGTGCVGGFDGELPGLVDWSQGLPPSQGFTTDVLTADLDGDMDLDIVWANQIPIEGREAPAGLEITFNDQGTFHAGDMSELQALGSWTFVRAVDLDGDHDLDLVATRPARTTAEVVVLANDGSGRIHEAPGAVPLVTGEADGLVFGRVAVGDVDGDDDPDLVVPVFSDDDQTSGRPEILLLNDGHGTFARDTEGRLPVLAGDDDWTLGVSLADYTGDGAVDLYLGQAERRQRLFVNDGTGRFRDESDDDGTGVARLPTEPFRAAQTDAGDLDGDGDLDIAIVNDAAITTGEPVPMGNHVLVNDGRGHFAVAALPLTDALHDSRSLACGDLDGDGITDVVIGNATEYLPHGGTAIEILLGQPDGTFTALPDLPRFDAGVFGVALGDLDGDGRLDIAAAVNEPGADGDLSDILLLSR
jgi:hypothetical protein